MQFRERLEYPDSYPSRFSIAEKKLSVAEAGYLSRLLAEKLYEYTVSVNDCGTSGGIEISYSPESDRLIVDGEILPSLGDMKGKTAMYVQCVTGLMLPQSLMTIPNQ